MEKGRPGIEEKTRHIPQKMRGVTREPTWFRCFKKVKMSDESENSTKLTLMERIEKRIRVDRKEELRSAKENAAHQGVLTTNIMTKTKTKS